MKENVITDPPRMNFKNGFSNTLEFIKYIRKNYNNCFSIVVPGHPEGNAGVNIQPPRKKKQTLITHLFPFLLFCFLHQSTTTYIQELDYLKQKIEAGADAVITQFFYDVSVFFKFVGPLSAPMISTQPGGH